MSYSADGLYEYWNLAGVSGINFRRPEPPASGPYFACLGGAQVFGRYVGQPFPSLLSAGLGVPGVNLGVAGAGPKFFADSDPIIELVNGGEFAVIVVMSGRSCSTPLWRCPGAIAGGRLVEAATGKDHQFGWAMRSVLNKGKKHAGMVARQFREAYMWDFAQLLARVRVPTYLVWMSARQPAFTPRLAKMKKGNPYPFTGKFPHFVNSEMLARLRANSTGFVSVVSSETAGPEGYYPGPKMHAAVAGELENVIRRDLSNPHRGDA